MNDSFLEDLDLVPPNSKQIKRRSASRNVTTRCATSSPLQDLSKNKLENFMQQEAEYSTIPIIVTPETKRSVVKTLNTRSPKKLLDSDPGKQQSKIRVSEKNERTIQNTLKPIENRVRSNVKNRKSNDVPKKSPESRLKVEVCRTLRKDQSPCSGSSKGGSSPDLSSKENSRPSGSSKEGSPRLEVPKEKERKRDLITRRSSTKENDPVALLNAVKDIVSSYTKQESLKVIKAMQELHLNSQANLIKHLMFQTDDLIKEMHPSKESARMRILIEQNERLHQDIATLQKKNEDLQKQLEEMQGNSKM